MRIIEVKKGQKRVYELLSHIVNSQKIWLSRALQKNIFPGHWENHSTERCINLSTEITSEWINFLYGLKETELEKRIKYKNNKGEDW